MFSRAAAFNKTNQPLTWNTSSVTDMKEMFFNASSFNQPISNWSTSNVTDMSGMFYGASSFNQNISGWAITNIIYADYIFCNCPNMLSNAGFRPNITYSGWISSCS